MSKLSPFTQRNSLKLGSTEEFEYLNFKDMSYGDGTGIWSKLRICPVLKKDLSTSEAIEGRAVLLWFGGFLINEQLGNFIS